MAACSSVVERLFYISRFRPMKDAGSIPATQATH